ncbi:YicC family protein [Halorhodospira halochloris]|uniref:YicC/YloC family endoribonuclease n=1 Tax=Halorhodospira halochloris TaxID=1052 RepID=UPI001EE90137|nr:YicC/YloC family endoribonuclease [Halorhodospira halochloris]MCG5529399.1 YicC family protein [Halorhodospira halochloris]
MTAFARREAQCDWEGCAAKLIWELRSVNHRYREIQPRLPEELRSLDPDVREHAAQALARGKLEAVLYCKGLSSSELEIDWQRVAKLASACDELLEKFSNSASPAPVTEFLRLPGVLNEPTGELQPIKTAALALFDDALAELVETRSREGSKLANLIQKRLEATRAAVEGLHERRSAANQQIRERLEARIANLPQPADPGRLEQELVYIAQRFDIDEELDRIQAHLDEVERLLDSQDAVGRRLDFLMQELNREANTIASKAADSTTSNTAVDLKVWVEQMREQVQNVE